MDPYNTLGLAPGSTDKEIKAAFKKLAKQHHPDVGGDEAKFKEINEAYSILTGKQEQPQQPNGFEGFGFGLHDVFNESIFDAIFRGGGNRMINQVRIDPEILIQGGSFDYTFQAYENRRGRLIPIRKTITIRIEPDTPAGAQIALPGTQPNHIFLQLFPGDTQRYRVSDMVHLMETQTIDVFKAMRGGEHEVTTPRGQKISIKIPAGTQSGSIHRVRAAGLRAANGTRGDYNVQFFVNVPAIAAETDAEFKTKILEHLGE